MAEVSQVVRIVSEQRKRCLASILTSAEQSPWWHRLSAEEKAAFRTKVVDSLGVFYDFVRDVVKVTDEDGDRNEAVLDLLHDIHTAVARRVPSGTSS